VGNEVYRVLRGDEPLIVQSSQVQASQGKSSLVQQFWRKNYFSGGRMCGTPQPFAGLCKPSQHFARAFLGKKIVYFYGLGGLNLPG
jgi:hypothetical protein